MNTLIGKSKSVQKIRETVRNLAVNRTHVVIAGEQGTGKSIVARMIHEQSGAHAKPFVILDTSQIDEITLRSIVQAIVTRQEFLNPATSGHGNFDLPDGATIILDAIERSSLPAQGIVLDLIENIRAGGLGFRLIILVGGSPKELSRSGQVSPDLVRATKDWPIISIPPLRERSEDIPDLIEHFVHETARSMNMGEMIIDVNAVSVLVRKEWKGNVQELKSFVERAMLLSGDNETFFLPESLVDEQSELAQMLEKIEAGVDFAIDRSMELIEKRILERVLAKFEFNQSRAARFLKITEDTLRYRMKKLGIQNPQ